jgi:hypothetical protein
MVDFESPTLLAAVKWNSSQTTRKTSLCADAGLGTSEFKITQGSQQLHSDLEAE